MPCSSFRHGLITVILRSLYKPQLYLYSAKCPWTASYDEKRMLRIAAIVVFTGLLSARSLSPDLASVKRIYLLSMTAGLDQYLANRLTRESRFLVTTDPKSADTLMTDRLGEGFEQRYNELYPVPEPPAPKESKDTKESKDSKDKKAEPSWKTTRDEAMKTSSFNRGKGNIFLVDRATRQVIWSYYLKPKNSSAAELNKVADHVIGRLVKDAKVKEPQKP